jgi:hypothetical protein
MPRQTNTSSKRLRESRTLILVGELLQRGARTKTVERLTGLSEVPIRDIYRELYSVSPTKGPSGYSHDNFVKNQTSQFDSTLAEVCVKMVFAARQGDTEAVAPELGYLYCSAYDLYKRNLAAIDKLIQPMPFERFSHLAYILSKCSILAKRKCTRCNTAFISPTAPGVSNQKFCPACRMFTTRSCSKCGVYVSLDSLDVSPKRLPMCKEHSKEYRPVTYNRRQYLADSQEEPALLANC